MEPHTDKNVVFSASCRRSVSYAIRLAVIAKADKSAAIDIASECFGAGAVIGDVRPSKISLLTPTQSKGLGFDGAAVAADGMSINELHIAMARDFEILYVTRASGKQDTPLRAWPVFATGFPLAARAMLPSASHPRMTNV